MGDNKKSKTLSETIGTELIKPTLDLSIDYSELALDSLLSDGILKEIPFMKSFVAIVKTGLIVKERFFLKKLLTFLKQFHSDKIDDERLIEFLDKFENNNKYRNKVIDQIMILNDRFNHVEKSKVFANLFRSHLKGYYDWSYLNSLLISLEVLHPEGFKTLKKLADRNFKLRGGESSPQSRDYDDLVHLLSAGLAYNTSGLDSSFIVTKMGQDLYEYGIKVSLINN